MRLLIGVPLLALALAPFSHHGRPAEVAPALVQDAIGEDFLDGLKDFNKATDRTTEVVAKLAALMAEDAKKGRAATEEHKKLVEKIGDNFEEMKRAQKALADNAKSESEKQAVISSTWAQNWVVRYANITIKATYDVNRRWAAFYAKVAEVMSATLKKSAKDKKWAGIKCDLCTNGMVECPACEGSGKCAAQVWSDEKCKDGYFHASNTRLCPVCQGTAVCTFCDGQGKMLCPIEHRVLGK